MLPITCKTILFSSIKPLFDSRILVCGVAYKADIDDYRESPSLRVIEHFENHGSIVDAFDPYIEEYRHKDKTYKCLTKITKEQLKKYDLVVITTGHKNVDYDMINNYSQLIFDTRNAMKDIKDRSKIELL